eukprot:TRINITY_DN1977_c0_g3_i1.p1 TRINITY_DN1977_c0_g3~~TRINITY_DN1977_c0_g3_i1.p1  ORF type:complete len:393 (+),score=181.47 TRINITY_DN1977_c0_g3_i1:52-1230(+)
MANRRAVVVDVQASAIRLEPQPNEGRNPLFYNFNDGGLESMVQGYRSALLRHEDYNALCQCETLQDVKMYLQTNTCYGDPPFLQDVATLDATVIKEKAQEKLVKEFNELREWADPPLSTFLDFITYDYMITNVLKLIQGARNNRDTLDLITRMHPLGKFEGMGAIMADCSTIDAIYDTMTILELPIMKFFQMEQDKMEFESDQSSMEYVHAMFKKQYLEAFYDLCQEIGGTTWDVMKEILEFEADRTVIGLTRNCFGNKDIKPGLDRSRLFPNFGTLLDWHSRIADCDDDESLRAILGDEKGGLHHWRSLVSGGTGGLGEQGSSASAMETRFIEKSIELNRCSMGASFHYGVFYSWLKLREQELSNLFWICACIEMKTRDRIREFSEIFPTN